LEITPIQSECKSECNWTEKYEPEFDKLVIADKKVKEFVECM